MSVSFKEHTNRVTDAHYTVHDTGTPLATVAINQQLAPTMSKIGAHGLKIWESSTSLARS
ncbi:MAG: hypothetical protein R3C49_04520 [Planctomycetaceae bacterium]